LRGNIRRGNDCAEQQNTHDGMPAVGLQ